MLRRVIYAVGIASDRIGSHRAAVQVVVLTYSFKRGQIIRFARHRPRSRLKYSDVGWRGKGQNKCYGITMDSVCSLTLYHHGVVVPSPLPLPLPPLRPLLLYHLFPRVLRLLILLLRVLFLLLLHRRHILLALLKPLQQPVALLMCVCVCVNIVRVFTTGYVCVCVCANMYSGSNILEHVEEGRRKERKKKERGEKREEKKAKQQKRAVKEGKIKEKIADSIGGNEFKMAGPQLKWRRDVNSRLLCANMTFLFAIRA